MDAPPEIDVDPMLVKFLGEIAHWNQTTAAKLLGMDRRRFNDYYNHRREAPDEILIKIETILQAHGIYLAKVKRDNSKGNRVELPILERAKQADLLIGGIKERRGKKRIEQNSEKHLKRKNFCVLEKAIFTEGRTDTWVAKKLGLHNATTLRHALKVHEEASPQLKHLTNEGTLRADQAYQVVQLPLDQQAILLKQDKKTIAVYLQAIQSSADFQKRRQQVYAQMMKKEAEIRQPLRHVFMGLYLNSNRKGYFDWEPLKLQQAILPSLSEAPFTDLLELLCQIGAIEKQSICQSVFGRILV